MKLAFSLALVSFILVSCDDTTVNYQEEPESGNSTQVSEDLQLAAAFAAEQAFESAFQSASSGQGNARGKPHRLQNFHGKMSNRNVVPAEETRSTGVVRFKMNKAGDSLAFFIRLNSPRVKKDAEVDRYGLGLYIGQPDENGNLAVPLYNAPAVLTGEDSTLNSGKHFHLGGFFTADDVLLPEVGNLDSLAVLMRMRETYVQANRESLPNGLARAQIR